MADSRRIHDGLIVPEDQRKRQAIGGLGGYIYQLYQTLASWLDLQDNETLLLEVAEDFAILAGSAIVGTQVRDTARSESVTLRSKGVRETTNSLWSFQEENPEKTVSMNYLTTSDIGQEKPSLLPDKQRGLDYWKEATREGSEVSPLRKALKTIGLAPEIMTFLEDSTDDQLRDKILRRIKWVCGADNSDLLKQTIYNRLVTLGYSPSFGSAPSDSEQAIGALLYEILEVVVRTSEKERKLTKPDLLRVASFQ